MLVSQLLFPLGLLSLVWRADELPLLWPCPKEILSCLHLHNVRDPKGGRSSSAGGAPSHGSLWGHCWPLGSSQLLEALPGGPPIPCHIPQLTLSTGYFKWVSLEGSSKMYLCEQCKKQTSNPDCMVSHCLQEHLGICLICPQCGMSNSDPLKFHLHGRGIHNLLFY